MRSELTLIPMVTIHPDRICYYQQAHWEPSKPQRRESVESLMPPKFLNSSFLKSSRKANGKVSEHAKRKLSKAIDYMLLLAREKSVKEKVYGKMVRFRLAFITLTLPSTQVHDDKEIINSCLNQFLVECKKHYQVNRYIWRAEKQKNGNIHFHLLVDTFIPWNELQNRWNRIINKLGYVDRFQEKNGNKRPNSTDIHSTRKVKDLKKYLAKYMTKNEQPEQESTNPSTEYNEQTGRIWSCSHDLNNISGLKMVLDSETETEIKKVISNSKCRSYESDYFTVWYVDVKKYSQYGSELLFKQFAEYIYKQFSVPINLKLAA